MKTTNYREVELNSILRVRLVCFHSGVGGGALLCVVVVLFAGSDVVGGACVGGGQGGFSDLILSMVEQDVGSVGLRGRRQRITLMTQDLEKTN